MRRRPRSRYRPLHTRLLRRPPLGTMALVPASELSMLRTWHHRSTQLGPDNVLVVIPAGNSQLQQVAEGIQKTLKLDGRKCRLTTTQ